MTASYLSSSGLIVSAADDLAAELLVLLRERGDETLAVGLLVVDRRDLLDAGLLEQVARGERALDRVGGAGAEVGRVGALRGGREVGALGERRAGVGRGDLVILADASTGCTLCATLEFSVPTTPTTSLSDDELGRGVLADVGLRLVVLGRELEGPARDGLGLVGLLDGQVDRVLDAEPERGEVAGQGRDDADLGDLVPTGTRTGRIAAAVATRATSGERERGHEQRGANGNHGTLRHVSS